MSYYIMRAMRLKLACAVRLRSQGQIICTGRQLTAMDSPAAIELPPCALGCLFNNKCSAERTQRNWSLALGYCDRAGRPRLTAQLGRPRSHDYRVYEEQDGSAGGPGGSRCENGKSNVRERQ